MLEVRGLIFMYFIKEEVDRTGDDLLKEIFEVDYHQLPIKMI